MRGKRSRMNVISKPNSLCILSLCVFFITSCAEEEQNNLNPNQDKIIFLNDTLCPTETENYGITKTGLYLLDINNDSVTDFKIFVKNHHLGRQYYAYTNVVPQNGFSLFTDEGIKTSYSENYIHGFYEPDTNIIIIPKIYSLMDTVSESGFLTNDSIILVYEHHDKFAGNSWGDYISEWLDEEDKFLGIVNNEERILCWIKIKVLSYDEIIIKSFKYIVDENELVISD